MDRTTAFPILFSYGQQAYAGTVYTASAHGMQYYTLIFYAHQLLFFVDDEQDAWIQHGEGATPLAAIVGEQIDRHFHPDAFRNNNRMDPE